MNLRSIKITLFDTNSFSEVNQKVEDDIIRSVNLKCKSDVWIHVWTNTGHRVRMQLYEIE